MPHIPDDRLRAYGQALLSGQEKATVKLHLSECNTCTARLETLVNDSEDPKDLLSGEGLQSLLAEMEAEDAEEQFWPPPEAYEFLETRWDLLGYLGHGRLGVVYKAIRNEAEDKTIPTTVALKVITTNPVDSKRVETELRAMKRIGQHRNLVEAYDYLPRHSDFVIEMEYVDGLTLADKVRKQGPLELREACGCVLQVLCGMDRLREVGIVHRDLKPSNLMVTHDSLVKILDFGLAKIFNDPDDPRLSITRQYQGTPHFSSPEQICNAKHIDYRTDMYSIGCVFYFLLTGQPPFTGNSLHEVFEGHRKTKPPSLQKLGVPPEIDNIVQKLLQKKPEHRYQEAGEAAQALWPHADEVSRSIVREWLEKKPKTCQPEGRGKWWVASVLVVLLLIPLVLPLYGVVLRLRTKTGTMIVELDEALENGNTRSIDWQIEVDQKPLKTSLFLKREGDRHWLEIKAESGKHELCVSKPGFKIYCKDIVVTSGHSVPVRVFLEPLESPQHKLAKVPGAKPEPPKEESIAPDPPGTPGIPIKFLSAMEPSQHAFKGSFEKKGDEITIESGSEVAIPWAPQNGYELKMTVERLDGNNAFHLGGIIGGSRFEVLIDGWPNDGPFTYSGLWRLDDVTARIWSNRDKCRKGHQLVLNTKHLIVYRVLPDQIFVSLDECKIIDEKDGPNGRPLRERVRRPEPRMVLDRYPLYFKASGAKFRITDAVLIPLGAPVDLVSKVQQSD